MANELDPRDEQGMQQQAGPGLAEQWRGFFQDPANRAFMLQTGLALMQQPAYGQNLSSHVSGAISQGGEAAGRVIGQEEARQEAASRQETRAAAVEAKQMHGEASLMKGEATLRNAQTREMMRQYPGSSEGRRVQAHLDGQKAFNAWLTNMVPPDPKTDPILAAVGAKSREEVAMNPAMRAKAIQILTANIPSQSLAPQPNMTPVPGQQNQTRIPGNSNIVGSAEGEAAGIYDSDLAAQARAAIYTRPQDRDRILRSYKAKTGMDLDL